MLLLWKQEEPTTCVKQDVAINLDISKYDFEGFNEATPE